MPSESPAPRMNRAKRLCGSIRARLSRRIPKSPAPATTAEASASSPRRWSAPAACAPTVIGPSVSRQSHPTNIAGTIPHITPISTRRNGSTIAGLSLFVGAIRTLESRLKVAG